MTTNRPEAKTGLKRMSDGISTLLKRAKHARVLPPPLTGGVGIFVAC
jgi:hypothetical protein